jgi:hypothetical protein
MNRLLLKLGNGDRRDGAWVVIIYALSTVPFWLALAGTLATWSTP